MWVLLLLKNKQGKEGKNECFQYQEANKEIQDDTIQRSRDYSSKITA